MNTADDLRIYIHVICGNAQDLNREAERRSVSWPKVFLEWLNRIKAILDLPETRLGLGQDRKHVEESFRILYVKATLLAYSDYSRASIPMRARAKNDLIRQLREVLPEEPAASE